MEFDATFLISIISFIVFVFIMNKIFYAPVLRIMSERQKFVDENYISAKETKNEVQKRTNLHNEELEKTREEARTTVAAQTKKFKQESSKIISEYKSELYENISKEKESLKNSAIEAKEVLKDNVIDIAKNISHIILGDDINSESINKTQIKEEEIN